MKEVTWFNPKVTIEGLTPDVYHVYLRHGATDDFRLPLDVEVSFNVEESEGNFKKVGATYPFKDMVFRKALKGNAEEFLSTYVGSIDLTVVPDKTSFNVKVLIA